MELSRLITAGVILPFLLALCVVTTGAAASGGTLVATDALGVKGGENAHVFIFLNGSYDPAVKALQLKVHYDESVAEVTNFSLNEDLSNVFGTDELNNPRSGFKLALASGKRIPTGTWLWDITFTVKPEKNDGSRMEVGLELEKIGVSDDISYMSYTTVQNGTFTTEDKVLPVITLDTKGRVPSTFDVAGTIHEAGEIKSAQATLKNSTHAAVVYDLLPLGGSAPDYTFNRQVTWPVENDVTLTVTAIDAAGNEGKNTTTPISVVAAGFSDPIPAPESYINEIPESASVLITEMLGPVTMCLGNATYEKDLGATIEGSCAKGTLPRDLADGEYWVEVSGTDNYGNSQSLNWTFTLDTKAPKIDTFTITDSDGDGDGYIEAGETLTLNWAVSDSDPSFARVALVDAATGKELWQDIRTTGTATTTINVGNRDLEFRAYDKAGNYAKRAFHLYNNYMIWVNSTKMGKVSGIDTTYTAAKDLSRTGVSSITLHNGRDVPFPTLDQLQKYVTNVGQVTNDTYVTVDKNANITVSGSDTYRNAWVYEPGTVLDFTVKVPNTQKAVLVLAEANESYIADLIKGGKGSMRSVDYMELVKKTAYIFIDGGWTEVTIDDKGKVNQGNSSGENITVPAYDTSVTGVLGHHKNQVDLGGNGYQLGAQGLKEIKLPPGDYALAAITVDDDRIGLLAAMPVVVLEDSNQGSISATSVKLNETFTAKFDTPCERLGVVLLRNNVAYKGTAFIDAATLGKDTLRLNITHSGIPATQKLIGNIYVSPNSGKYVVANTNQATVSTTGLDAGTYQVYLAGQSARGTMQAYGVHTLEITPAVTPTPTPYYHRGSGGGSGSTTASYTGTGTLLTGSSGTVLKSIIVNANDNIGGLLVPIGVKALDADGKPLGEISLSPLAGDAVPAIPSGSVFRFAGYAYEAGPDGATFSPGITLSLNIPEDVWKTLDPNSNKLTMKWYNKETGLWEDVQTTVIPGTRTVEIRITHFSIYALFTEPVTTVTPIETATTTTTTTPTTPSGDQPAEGLPMMMILAIFAVLVIVIAAGYFFMMRK